MILINAGPSPYGRKVAVALKEKKIPFELQVDLPWSGSTRTPEYSPLEQLPILVLDNGEAIYDSTYILEWLELRYPKPALLPSDVEGILAVKKLQMLGERIMEYVATLAFEYKRPQPGQAWLDRHLRKVLRGLGEVNRLIGDRRPNVHEPITTGDIAVATTVRVFDYMISDNLIPDVEAFRWRAHSNLSAFVDALEERASFRETQPQKMELDLTAVIA